MCHNPVSSNRYVICNMYETDTTLWQGQQSHAIELTLFLWHMLDGATERVAEHSSRLQPSINLHALVTAFMFSCSSTQCTT